MVKRWAIIGLNWSNQSKVQVHTNKDQYMRAVQLSLWLEIDSSTVNNDSVRVRVHFIEALKGCGSNYTLGTLVLHSRSASNDSRRDIYIYDKFVSTVSDFPSTSSWMMVARDGAVIIIELQDCGISREFGLFLLER